MLNAGRVTSCLFDKTRGSFTLKRQGLFGTKVIEHRIREIADVQVEESKYGKGSTSYRVTIVLVSGDRLPITLTYVFDTTLAQETAECIRRFLNLNNQISG